MSSFSETDEKKLECLWNSCLKSNYLINDDFATPVELYHATTLENRKLILTSGELLDILLTIT